MIKKILDIFFTKGKTTITDTDVEEYLKGVEVVSSSDKSKNKQKSFLLLCFLVIVVVALGVSTKFFLYSSPPTPIISLKKVSKTTKTTATSAMDNAHSKASIPHSTVSTRRAAPTHEPLVGSKNSTASITHDSASSYLELSRGDSFDLLENLENPFDLGKVSSILEEFQVKSKILDKKIEVSKKTAEYLEYLKKVKDLKNALESNDTATSKEAKATVVPKNSSEVPKEAESDKSSSFEETESFFSTEANNKSTPDTSVITKDSFNEEASDSLFKDLFSSSSKESTTQDSPDFDQTLNTSLPTEEHKVLTDTVETLRRLSRVFQPVGLLDKERNCLYFDSSEQSEHYCIHDSIYVNETPFTIENIFFDTSEYRVTLTNSGQRYEVLVQTR